MNKIKTKTVQMKTKKSDFYSQISPNSEAKIQI